MSNFIPGAHGAPQNQMSSGRKAIQLNLFGFKTAVEVAEEILDDSGDQMSGDTNIDTNRIRILKSLDREKRLEVMLHELVHKILLDAGINHEEHIAGILGLGLHQALSPYLDELKDELESLT